MSNWYLNKIPKMAHFYWGAESLPYLRMMSIITFHKLNPDWEVLFWYPAKRYTGEPTWKTGEQNYKVRSENYMYYFMTNFKGISKIPFDMTSIGFQNNIPENFKADILKWYILSSRGGLISDNDIIYFRPMNECNFNNPENAEADTFVCTNGIYHSVGFLLASANNNFYKKIYNLARSSFSPKNYQSVGNSIFKINDMLTLDKCNGAKNIDMDVVYPLDSYSIDKIFKGNHSDRITPNTIGLHFYAGSYLAEDMINNLNDKNLSNWNNTLADCLRIYLNKTAINKFVIITTVRNSESFIEGCINSVKNQNYINYEMIIIDDASTDRTPEIINKLKTDKIKAFFNKEKRSKMENIIFAISQVKNDNDIILMLDGDDQLYNPEVLSYLNTIYTQDVWLTYGQFEPRSKSYKDYCKPIKTREYRNNKKWLTSHLKTFRKFLFQKIKESDLKTLTGNYYITDDIAFMLPMIEMSGDKHLRFIEKVLYLYNDENPSCVMYQEEKKQLAEKDEIFQREKYPEIDRLKISILITTFKRDHLLKWNLFSLSLLALKNIYDIETIILDDHEPTEEIKRLCSQYRDILNIKYINTGLTKTDKDQLRIPGFAFNIGIKESHGKYLILSCAEMFHINNTIDIMISEIAEKEKTLALPIYAKDDNKTFLETLERTGGTFSESNYINLGNLNNNLPFLMAVKKDQLLKIGGFDEDFIGIGYDDNDIMSRLKNDGVSFNFVDAKTIHLYHDRFNYQDEKTKEIININKNLYTQRQGKIVRNEGKDWGRLIQPITFSKQNEGMITLTFTTCKRLNLFEKTFNSFFENCLDLDLISEILIIDDGSSFEDLSRMKKIVSSIYKPFSIIIKSEYNKGHARSINMLLTNIKTDLWLQCEDDWEFKQKDNFIRKALKIMNSDPEIKSVAFRWGDNGAINQNKKQIENISFIKYEYQRHFKDYLGKPAWPGWNLNPSLQKISEIKTIGKMNEEVNGFEVEFSHRYNERGFRVAYFPFNYCEHLGYGNSAYLLNQTGR